ncbi:class I SAM-dependent methyltransferase [Streptomyces sp. SDr-06]|uniref:class I SAM-dependent methyltransferase n=1 Tax=Streptomyces sp. SDr-06 TaxID=2267702 RepID=UPI000DE853A2|nr:class I SAM-dependent methyltransferase [Streptomyces sp. SDr-06]RCH70066.1 class I SAM-dependent methyltransferase [Streptomyces sp. SDr-06]
MSQTTSAPVASPAGFSDVKGWFWPADQLLFDWFLKRQDKTPRQAGDLLELGAYLGKSAIFIGGYLRPGEEFTVCDLFDSPAPDDPNSAEMDRSYSTLTRRAFEANYLAFHEELPTIVQAPTSVIASRLKADSCRFIHVDASHLYEHVHGDIEAARELAAPDAIVAFDDFRAEHCPGVAAAVWGAVATKELKLICITGTKAYGTWGDAEPVRTELLTWLKTRTDLWHGVEEVAGAPLIRISGKKAQAPTPPRPLRGAPAQEAAPAAAAVPAHAAASRGLLARALGGRRRR